MARSESTDPANYGHRNHDARKIGVAIGRGLQSTWHQAGGRSQQRQIRDPRRKELPAIDDACATQQRNPTSASSAASEHAGVRHRIERQRIERRQGYRGDGVPEIHKRRDGADWSRKSQGVSLSPGARATLSTMAAAIARIANGHVLARLARGRRFEEPGVENEEHDGKPEGDRARQKRDRVERQRGEPPLRFMRAKLC